MAIRRLAFTYLALVTILSAQIPASSAEVLYNGIELPEDWPPARTLEELRRRAFGHGHPGCTDREPRGLVWPRATAG